jgi:hypothetical protein
MGPRDNTHRLGLRGYAMPIYRGQMFTEGSAWLNWPVVGCSVEPGPMPFPVGWVSWVQSPDSCSAGGDLVGRVSSFLKKSHVYFVNLGFCHI